MADKPIIFSGPMVRALLDGRKTQTRRIIKDCANVRISIGDRLWVRENFCVCNECGYYDQCADANSAGIGDRKCCRSCDSMLPKRMRPSIHMPRWASRLTLIVTDVRVQRLQDISNEDAIAEGIKPHGHAFTGYGNQSDIWMAPYESFESLWNSLHGPDAWSENPWAAAITFRTINANIDSLEATNG